MKLTITNPEVLDTLTDFPVGLWPVRRSSDSRMILIVKASREVAQTARLRGGFRFYLVPIQSAGVATYGLLTAFFDDKDEPLVLRTPLFNEEITRDFISLLSSDSFCVHFFDQRNRELLGFRAENSNALRFRILSNTIRFVAPTLERARHCLDAMQSWFGARSPSDDAASFAIHLRERLFPDSLAEHVDNPGDRSESDIATALRRAFQDDAVFINPARADNGREFVDVLVMTSKSLLLVQAKDNPDTQSALTRKIVRKKATAAKHVRKAAAQLTGSINHLRSGESIVVTPEGERRDLSMSGRNVFGLVIVKELFDPERPSCSPFVLTVFEETGIPCLLLDHTEFQQLAFFRTTEESFVGTLAEIFSVARAYGVFPRNRFGLRTDKAVVYEPRGPGNSPEGPTRPISVGNDVTTTQPSENSAVGESTRIAPQEDLRTDWLRVVVDRSEVEALDVSRTAMILSRVLADKDAVKWYRGRVDVAFSGYANDPRELYEVPEVRRFCSALDDAFPYWFYFLSTDAVTLGLIACCLCSVTELRPGVVSLGPDLLQFMTRHFGALNWLVDNYSLDENQNVEISGNVADYFGKSEPTQSPVRLRQSS